MATEESNSSDGESITMEEYSRYERQYWRAMAESETVQSVIAHLQIVDVATETKEEEDVKPPNERLNAKIAHVYITFKGLAKSRRLVEIGEHVERKAIIRRVIDASGNLTLLGKFWSGKDTEQQPSMTLPSGQQAESSKKRPRAG
ncbi:unnamed protein product [Arabidopsis arenosa]|uniref:Uncharacterized protein n=1 Tax=Arabidopsis arenosa TaxID=38785 RepID=A0A8S1ZG30_ARAAE|nr:unnamed protein product [Arabidopsis arenosa]